MIYFYEIRKSKCVLVVLTPNAMSSPYVRMEIGAAFSAQVKIIAVLAGGLTKKDVLDSSMEINWENVIELDGDNAEDGLTHELCRILSLPAPGEDEFRTLKRILSMPRSLPEVIGNSNDSESFSLNALVDPSVQTRENALKWLDAVEKNVLNKARMRGIKVEMLPRLNEVHGRIAMVMMSSDENKFDELMPPFAPLIDDQFIQYIKTLQETAYQSDDEKNAKTLLKLLLSSRRLLEKGKK
jgi:hypothetical protein